MDLLEKALRDFAQKDMFETLSGIRSCADKDADKRKRAHCLRPLFIPPDAYVRCARYMALSVASDMRLIASC